MYHRFASVSAFRRLSAYDFEQHLAYLVRHFRVRRLSELARSLRQNSPLEARTIVLTFDDGYADFIEHAYPVLERYEVPVTLFLVSEFADGRLWLWFDAIQYLIDQTREVRCDLSLNGNDLHLELTSVGARRLAWGTIADECASMDPAEQRAAIARLQDALQLSLPSAPTADYRAMTWDEARRLDSQLVDFGSHTYSHPILSRCTTAQIHHEVHESKRVLEAQLRRSVDAFCYPSGRPEDYDERAIQSVAHAEYGCATVAHAGPIRHVDPYTLPRTGAPHHISQFRGVVNGLTDLNSWWYSWR
jgi:peptidoglycan/xylan/chitin deacetylase (PgdA/CDA1 family)